MGKRPFASRQPAFFTRTTTPGPTAGRTRREHGGQAARSRLGDCGAEDGGGGRGGGNAPEKGSTVHAVCVPRPKAACILRQGDRTHRTDAPRGCRGADRRRPQHRVGHPRLPEPRGARASRAARSTGPSSSAPRRCAGATGRARPSAGSGMRRARAERGRTARSPRSSAAACVGRVVTQNVDRLHRKAGSRRVIELHGALAEVVCLACGALEDRDALQARILATNPGWVARRRADARPTATPSSPRERVEAFLVPACASVRRRAQAARRVLRRQRAAPGGRRGLRARPTRRELSLVVGTRRSPSSPATGSCGAQSSARSPWRSSTAAPCAARSTATLKIEAGTGKTLDPVARALAS